MTQAYNLSQLANNLNTAGQLDATDGLVNAVPPANGGTGVASLTAAAALFGNLLFPVGSIYSNTSNATNPAALLGFGTWTALGAGQMLVGYSAGDPLFGTAGNTGGSRNAIIVSHTHTATSTDSGHTHSVVQEGGRNTSSSYQNGPNQPFRGEASATLTTATGTANITTTLAATGSSGTNANLPPYLTVYMWQRTA